MSCLKLPTGASGGRRVDERETGCPHLDGVHGATVTAYGGLSVVGRPEGVIGGIAAKTVRTVRISPRSCTTSATEKAMLLHIDTATVEAGSRRRQA